MRVAILGGGCTGVYAALEFAAHGHDVWDPGARRMRPLSRRLRTRSSVPGDQGPDSQFSPPASLLVIREARGNSYVRRHSPEHDIYAWEDAE